MKKKIQTIKVKVRYCIAVCPFCGYECDGCLYDFSEYPGLMDNFCMHLEKIRGGIAYFSEEKRPEINPFER